MRIIICDIYVRLMGHNLGHIQNILQFLEKYPSTDNEYIFLLNPEAKTIPSVVTSAENVNIIFFTDSEFDAFHSGTNLIKSTQILWRHITRYATDLQADRVIMMMVDMFQHTVGNGNFPCQISGVLFSPYARISPQDDSFSAKKKAFLTKSRKFLTTWWMCRNPQLRRVFVFNDTETVERMNRNLRTNVFTYLPDPVYDYPTRAGLQIREKFAIAPNKKIFLAFGFIEERKNIINIIRAMQSMQAEEAANFCLLIVGKISAAYNDAVMEALEIAKATRPELQIELETRFIDDDEMEVFVGQSDIISIAYINFFASSGVIGLAARHNKPVLATKHGVIGNLTREYNLGLTVDGLNHQEMKEALLTLAKNKSTYPERASAFVDKHSGEAFIKALLEL
ncbi:MAG: glycosyltransferase [Spirosomataceae bacterium]